jgi:hypothetical protein
MTHPVTKLREATRQRQEGDLHMASDPTGCTTAAGSRCETSVSSAAAGARLRGCPSECGSISARRRTHGTTCSISPRNTSRLLALVKVARHRQRSLFHLPSPHPHRCSTYSHPIGMTGRVGFSGVPYTSAATSCRIIIKRQPEGFGHRGIADHWLSTCHKSLIDVLPEPRQSWETTRLQWNGRPPTRHRIEVPKWKW